MRDERFEEKDEIRILDHVNRFGEQENDMAQNILNYINAG